jgi:hypothetical protein
MGGTDTIATDDLGGGVKVQRSKVGWGVDGSYADVTLANPLPMVDVDNSTTGVLSATDAVLGVHGGAGVLLTGTPTASSYLALALTGGESSFTLNLTGTFGGGTVWFECSANSSNGVDGHWTTLSCRLLGTSTTTITESTTTAGLFRGNASGMQYIRVRITGATGPSVTAAMRISAGLGPVGLNAPIPAGTNLMGGVNGGALLTTSGAIAAAGTGTIGPLNVATQGNVSFIIKNTVAASAWAGAPVVVFEQSDDNGSWSPMQVVRNDTGEAASTWILPVGAANASLVFEAPLEGISYVRARFTTGPTTNGLTCVISAGGFLASSVVTTIDRKDAARSIVAVQYNNSTPPTTDALITTLVLQKGSTQTTAQTSIPVASGKRLKIVAITVSTRSTTAATPYAIVTLRVNFSGAAVLASPPILQVPVSGTAAASGNMGSVTVQTDIELVPGNQFCLSWFGNVATNVAAVSLIGYEYTA